MDVRRLALLRELDDQGVVGIVADEFGITPSAVSQQLKILEHEAGVPLVEPAGRGVSLTAAGRELSRLARNLSAEIARLEGDWREYVEQPYGHVTMTIFPSAAEMFLPGVLASIAQEDRLSLECSDLDPSNQYSPSDLALKFDLVIADTPQQDEKWQRSGLVSVPLMTEPLDVVLPLGHRLAGRKSVKPSDVIDETWVGSPRGFPIDRVMQRLESQAGANASVVQRFNDNAVVETLVAAGHGIALLPRFTTYTHDAKLVLVPLVGMESSREIAIVMRPDRLARLSVRKVVEAFKAEAKNVRQRTASA
jgi:DNA-binding transcriptional LysR family regulator